MAGPGSSSEDEGDSHSDGEEASKMPRKVWWPPAWVGEGFMERGHGSGGTPNSTPAIHSSISLSALLLFFCTEPSSSQRVQTKTKAPQAAGSSSQQRPPTPEETKPATPEFQEDANSEGEQSGQLEGGGPGVEAWVSRRRGWRLSKGKLGLVFLAYGLGPDMCLGVRKLLSSAWEGAWEEYASLSRTVRAPHIDNLPLAGGQDNGAEDSGDTEDELRR